MRDCISALNSLRLVILICLPDSVFVRQPCLLFILSTDFHFIFLCRFLSSCIRINARNNWIKSGIFLRYCCINRKWFFMTSWFRLRVFISAFGIYEQLPYFTCQANTLASVPYLVASCKDTVSNYLIIHYSIHLIGYMEIEM